MEFPIKRVMRVSNMKMFAMNLSAHIGFLV